MKCFFQIGAEELWREGRIFSINGLRDVEFTYKENNILSSVIIYNPEIGFHGRGMKVTGYYENGTLTLEGNKTYEMLGVHVAFHKRDCI